MLGDVGYHSATNPCGTFYKSLAKVVHLYVIIENQAPIGLQPTLPRHKWRDVDYHSATKSCGTSYKSPAKVIYLSIIIENQASIAFDLRSLDIC